jgi:hypothetical protein
MSPFKTLLLPKDFDLKTLRFDQSIKSHLIGLLCEENKVQIVKSRYSNAYPLVTLDEWYNIVKTETTYWNNAQKREDKNIQPTLTIREGLICDNCKKQCNNPCIELTNNDGEKTTHCLDCLTNILHVFKNYK